MLTNWITQMDFKILNGIREYLTCEFADVFFPIFTSLGKKGWFYILIAVILFCLPKYRKWGASLGCSLLLGFIFGNMLLKNVVTRTRPYDLTEGVTLLVEKLGDYSFPSGHTLAAFEFFTVICMMPIKNAYKILTGIFAFTMAFSRLYLYVHFPSDVLAGMLLGILFGLMGVRIIKFYEEEKNPVKPDRAD